MTDPLTQQMPSFMRDESRDDDITMSKDYSEHRYVICADVTDPTETPKLVFLAHVDSSFYWTATGNLPLVCYGDNLLEMEDLMTAALNETTAQLETLQLKNIRPYILTSTLSPCYDEYLRVVKTHHEEELFDRFDKMLSENFGAADRALIEHRIQSAI